MSSSGRHASQQSVSSNTSAQGTSRSDRSSRANGSPAVESAVTRLLVSIKQLLEALALWSTQKMTEVHVSDVYVRLGNDFNAAVAAFAAFNIDMAELMSVPNDLRIILEQCLAEDATPDNLEIYLPDVRKIITRLLQGLRGKQSVYRHIVSKDKHRSTDSGGGERPESRSSRSSRREGANTNSITAAHRTTFSRGTHDSSDGGSRRSAASTRRKDPTTGVPPLPQQNGGDEFVGGFAMGAPQNIEALPSRASTPQPRRQTSETNVFPASRTVSMSASGAEDRVQRGSTPQPEAPPLPVAPPPPPSQVPSHVKRYSLVDRPTPTPPPPPEVVIDEAPPAQQEEEEEQLVSSSGASPPPPLDAEQAPAVQSSLAALKKSDALERRASKRFSTYNISKMTGGSIRERGGASGHANRRSMAVSSALTPGDLAVLTEGDEATPSPRKRERIKGTQGSRNPSPIAEDDEAPPVPPLPSRNPSPAKPSALDERANEAKAALNRPPETASSDTAVAQDSPLSFPVFLQVGREVKKVVIEPGLSFSSLRVLFVDKFAYSPGQDNFPAIYIRDPSSGVQYELEDMDEVKEKCLLSLNIEPLDQIKQHIDSQISSLSQDIKDLRAVVSNNRRNSLPPVIIGQPLAESPSTPARPTDRQLRNVARRLSRILPDEHSTPTNHEPLAPQITGSSSSLLQPQMTGASAMSDYSMRIVTDLKTQFDEVQNLRRDLGIMRQLYTEFMKQTKESLGALRIQTHSVRQLATAKVGGARAYIDDGKAKLDSRSQNVLTKMEELQDTVEGIKDDVLKRNVSPRAQILRNVKADIDAVNAELQSLKDHIQTIKPMWKKTWEEELQNIVEEQQFLSHQEEFLGDLLEDQKAVLEVYGHVEKVISLRGTGPSRGARGRGFKPPPPEEGHNGLSTVMLEIRGASIDPERRLKAIAANEKIREKELASRSDEFQAELNGFVAGKRLKMTGGAEEVERVRQRRNDMTLKAMFTGSNPGTPSPSFEELSSVPATSLSEE